MSEWKKRKQKEEGLGDIVKRFYLVSLFVVFVDQILKFIFERNFVLGQSVPIIKNVFHLTLVHNYGAGFGILQGHSWSLFWLGFIFLGFILFYWDQIKSKEQKFFLALIAGGIIGNMIDRALFGYVVDFIDFRFWPAFNIADSCMVIGVAGYVFSILKNK